VSPSAATARIDPSAAGSAKDRKATCFVVGPFGEPDSRQRAWSDCLCEILPLAVGDDYVIQRTIDDPRAGNITETVQNMLGSADIVIADLSDGNANAFYELGFRHGRGLPFVLTCRAGTVIPFNLKTYAYTAIDATYDEHSRKYLVGQIAKVISELRSQVEDARRNPPLRTFIEEGAYRVRVFSWTTSYSTSIATDWLDVQDEHVQHVISEYERPVPDRRHAAPSPPDRKTQALLAEYLSLKGAAGKLWEGDVLYFLNSTTRELALGYAAYQFPTGPIVIQLSGTEQRDGLAQITFDQPERQVSVTDLQVTLPRYKFTVQFQRSAKTGTFSGEILHPTSETVVGQATLAPKWGFRADN
jgi:hypothetical protein